jgi:hypothetical protein
MSPWKLATLAGLFLAATAQGAGADQVRYEDPQERNGAFNISSVAHGHAPHAVAGVPGCDTW